MARSAVERLESRRRQLLAALDRIEAGTFGLCCACESDLDPARLENDPAVVFCKACLMNRDKPGHDLA
jgi:DnaK suppressor protein